jgi:hypothetical protein
VNENRETASGERRDPWAQGARIAARRAVHELNREQPEARKLAKKPVRSEREQADDPRAKRPPRVPTASAGEI